jgi:predicted dehydrogenase
VVFSARKRALKILLVGLGSIGRRHLANLPQVVPGAEIVVLRQAQHSNADDETLAETVSRIVRRVEDALAWQPHAALICTPAPFHIELALRLAEQGVHLFVEKPLSRTLEGVDRLIDLCQNKHLVFMVGYNLRFHSAVQQLHQAVENQRIGRILTIRAEVGQYLPHWRPAQDYRTSVSARRVLGGGALLELSHELDLVRWLAGEVHSIYAAVDRLGDLEMDVEDTAEITLRIAGGAIGSVHLDMLQQPPTRTCKIVGTEGTLCWDAFVPGIRWYDNRAGAWTELGRDTEADRNGMYVAELRHFFDCIAGQGKPLIDGAAGRRVLELVLAARKSAETGRTIVV